ncbi:hypothetical protein MY3296_002657 [Beauveria thailandica]
MGSTLHTTTHSNLSLTLVEVTGWENFHAPVKKDGIRIDVFSSVQISLNASTWISATG